MSRNEDSYAAALTKAGVATASVEYRRVGNDGGGAPGTFDDIEAAFDALPRWAGPHRLDLGRAVVAGHSAGGHLALWLGAPCAAKVRGVFALAPVADLTSASNQLCGTTISRLLGPPPDYARYSPADMQPLRVPQWLLDGDADTVPPSFGADYERKARAAGDRVVRQVFPGAGHFELNGPGEGCGRRSEAAGRRHGPPRTMTFGGPGK